MNNQNNQKKDKIVIYKPYLKSTLCMKVSLLITEIGNNIEKNLEQKIVHKIEGKCIVDGYIRPKSVSIKTHSAGSISSKYINYHVSFDCMVCTPVEGMLLEAVVKTITKAGIHAEVVDEENEQTNIPITVFVSRDLNTDKNFNDVKEKNKITVKVIGSRYELNDPTICVIAKLMNNNY